MGASSAARSAAAMLKSPAGHGYRAAVATASRMDRQSRGLHVQRHRDAAGLPFTGGARPQSARAYVVDVHDESWLPCRDHHSEAAAREPGMSRRRFTARPPAAPDRDRMRCRPARRGRASCPSRRARGRWRRGSISTKSTSLSNWNLSIQSTTWEAASAPTGRSGPRARRGLVPVARVARPWRR